MSKQVAIIACVAVVMLANGCAYLGLQSDVRADPPQIGTVGLVNSYLSLGGFERRDDNIINVGLFNQATRPQEMLSLDIWPIVGVGVGIVGARARVLPLELGLGVLGYRPALPPDSHDDDIDEALYKQEAAREAEQQKTKD